MADEVVVQTPNGTAKKDWQGLLRVAISNPLLTGLAALLVNQAAYKAGLYDPRPSPDGRYYTWKTTWGFSTDGGFHLDLGSRDWVQVDPEQVAADNATMIGVMLLGATIAYAGASKTVIT